MTGAILSVAYPFAAVGPDAAGGAEQVLSAVESAIVRSGRRSIVIAQEGSRVAGECVALPRVDAVLTEAARDAVRRQCRTAIEAVAAREAVDLIHFHGIDFPSYRPDLDVPMLATLHLPADWYDPSIFRPGPRPLWLNPVSATQAAACPSSANLLAPIENGVPVDRLQAIRVRKRDFALVLARICPEKGVHLAIEAARATDIDLVIAGEVFAYPEHQRYFADEIAPRLDSRRRFVGPVGFARKRRLLHAAQCLLVPALVDETSSLVAREAIACGTAVVAFRRGALPEAVRDGETGFLVDDVAGMAAAIARARDIDPEWARAVARERFSLDGMTGRYLGLYRELTAAHRRRGAA
ncbi:glycosyl transferase family 1 [Alsobacter metallidurans]|uniref:Glycosyl transferase family 1 n=1 Tax=Alsobacter metallidurans TaxID=340221 RepID=A0A917ICH3_9HYPH|nr:glycosyltransferase [Alsobacter metallidurans]GGH32628.1 glycosyl transferase family 1 [Alsobacter metallidurans]